MEWQYGQIKRGYQCTRPQSLQRGTINFPCFAPSQNGSWCCPLRGTGLLYATNRLPLLCGRIGHTRYRSILQIGNRFEIQPRSVRWMRICLGQYKLNPTIEIQEAGKRSCSTLFFNNLLQLPKQSPSMHRGAANCWMFDFHGLYQSTLTVRGPAGTTHGFGRSISRLDSRFP